MEKRGEILTKQVMNQLKTLADQLDLEVTGSKVRLLRLRLHGHWLLRILAHLHLTSGDTLPHPCLPSRFGCLAARLHGCDHGLPCVSVRQRRGRPAGASHLAATRSPVCLLLHCCAMSVGLIAQPFPIPLRLSSPSVQSRVFRRRSRRQRRRPPRRSVLP